MTSQHRRVTLSSNTRVKINAANEAGVRELLPLENVVVLDTGERVPVTNKFDEHGEDTSDWLNAVSFVAGPRADGMWVGAQIMPDDLDEYRDQIRDAKPEIKLL